MAKGKEVVTRSDLRGKLVLNAATRPVNVVVPAAVAVAGLLLGAPWLLGIAAVVYVALAVATFFDGDEAEKVGQRAYAGARASVGAPAQLSPAIRARLEAALAEERAIEQTVREADLPFAEVSDEVRALVVSLRDVASRADRLQRFLATQDPAAVERRLAELRRGGEDAAPTWRAVREQRDALAQVQRLLARYDGEMEQVQASLAAVHARLVQLSVTSQEDGQVALAGDVRELRSRVETLTDAMTKAYEST